MAKRTPVLAGLLFVFIAFTGCTAASPQFPEFTAPVVDAVGAVDDSIELALSQELERFRSESGPQIAVAVIDTTGDAAIEDYSIDLARQWAIGDAQRDDGVLILIALEDREMRIEVGSGVEGELTDVAAGRIIDGVILPRLRADDVDAAVAEGARAVMAVWRGEPVPVTDIDDDGAEPSGDLMDSLGALLFIALIGGSMALFLVGAAVRKGRYTTEGGQFQHGWLHFPTSSGGGSGGFGGGFGGGFSGGGAGGSW